MNITSNIRPAVKLPLIVNVSVHNLLMMRLVTLVVKVVLFIS